MTTPSPAAPTMMRAPAPGTGSLRGGVGWAMLAISVASYAAASIGTHQPFHMGVMKLGFFDLRIYHLGALRLTHGVSLYGAPMVRGLGFTYPPFAALVMAPLALVPMSVDTLAVTALSIALLVWTLHSALSLRSGRPAREQSVAPGGSQAAAWSLAAGFAAAALWLEPITVTLGYGQIDLLIAALVLFDLSRPDHARSQGVAIGLAAAIKLTPLLFIVYLLFSRRRRAACIAAGTFVTVIALSFAAIPHDAAAYWGGTVFDTSRVGNLASPINQSLMGVIARTTGTHHPGSAWELLVAVVALGGIALAARAHRRGDEAAGFSLAAISTLLASPISWPHHWTLAVPALVLLARRAGEQRSRALWAGAALLGLVGCAYLPEIADTDFASTSGVVSLLTSDPYPLIALAVLAVCAAPIARACVYRLRPVGRVQVHVEPAIISRRPKLEQEFR